MGQPVAALLLLYFNRTVEYYVPATLEAERVHQPTSLILFQAMQDAARAGYTRWNWGGTWLNQDGVSRFKRKWGAQDSRYRYYIKLNAAEILKRSRSELLDAYPGFYVVPFDKLHEE
jgi:lipid II:glycine glycyltransferase (peptidoglycan interpeptide bridge formation enzyme)